MSVSRLYRLPSINNGCIASFTYIRTLTAMYTAVASNSGSDGGGYGGGGGGYGGGGGSTVAAPPQGMMSHVVKGAAYEITTKNSLEQIGCKLQRIGCSGDEGVDLYGTWSLPNNTCLAVTVQCKLTSKPLQPAVARELIGSYIGRCLHDTEHSLVILVSSQPFSSGVIRACNRAPVPIAYSTIDPCSGQMKSFFQNDPANRVLPVELSGTGSGPTAGVSLAIRNADGDLVHLSIR